MSFENKYASLEQYLRKVSGLEKEVILVDHNYVKPWNAHPESYRTKPARLLFMKGLHRYPVLLDRSYADEEINVEICDEPIVSPFDNPKIKALANECEKSLKNNHLFKDREQEEFLDLSKLSASQKKLHEKVMQILNEDKLSKLCYNGSSNEAIKKRLSVDRAARQIRQIFGLIFWDMKLISWLHQTLINHCDISTLTSYIDVLQTLKAKIPTLIEKILLSYAGNSYGDAVIQIVKKSWDPVFPVLNQNKPRKLPGNPIVLICPCAPNQNILNTRSPRMRFWQNNLSLMCKVMNIPAQSDEGKVPSTIEEYLEQMLKNIRNKVTELKNHYPNRPLILLGWTIGALIACHIALQEPIDGIICLGFPLTGVNGFRGDLNDPLLDSRVPTLFIVGQNARMCSSDDIEDFRSRMRAETGLVVVGGCDDLLRMCPQKMKAEKVTQAVVDRCLLDEIIEFMMSVVVKLPSASAAAASVSTKAAFSPIMEENEAPEEDAWKPEEEGKRKRRKPREYSPELSPVRRRARHHIQRQPTSAKARLSPDSSESSSSVSGSNETPATKPAKKLPEKRIGRPAAGTWRKRTPGRPLASYTMDETPQKMPTFADFTPSISSTPTVKSPVPFSKNILPKKNDPVDVEKAFGRDSSFLPRPLTPPEPEDTVSAEETEKALAELEAMSNTTSDTTQIHDSTITATSLLSEMLSSDRAFLPISDFETGIEELKAAPPSVIEPMQTNPIPAETKTTISLPLTSSLHTALTQNKHLSPTSLQALKNAGGFSILANNPGKSSSPPKSTIITVPSPSAATILVSSPAIRSQPAKMIQLLAKGNSTLAVKNTSCTRKESSEQQSCNLSLLSDVAGMTEHMNNSSKMVEAGSQSATLVKLTPSEKTSFQGMRCLKVVKTMRPASPPARYETPEELAEKQLAIQSLNKSIGIETQSNVIKDPGYSICYAKPDGSIVSRSVTRPNFPGYITVPSSVASNRGRGRGRYMINKQIRFNM
ncbi:KAT8 regulatory NSL complex subunit 3 [Caerostris darwini]|uniref:KAT8 regulatory NSL complex subunit 3 n=1 Tax=Caerostris darwini TaxID=1538125 RepID=A0AAV4X0L5_9ARAC|nr:KAT8 regulatory NSL complex subunit 3 [Caerostris darwini]